MKHVRHAACALHPSTCWLTHCNSHDRAVDCIVANLLSCLTVGQPLSFSNISPCFRSISQLETLGLDGVDMKASTRGSRDNSKRKSPLLPTMPCWLHQREMKTNSRERHARGNFGNPRLASNSVTAAWRVKPPNNASTSALCAHFNITSTPAPSH